ncbi:hypothetical protein D3C73_791360 [compost metagenome]|uniref:Sporulation protein YjcZ n=2 Tax=Paenibacillus jilunlii TaxID=682956 RepID=A0A1G9MHB7_9BACL|nr:hypothetical protein [Paenibacillus jilunlii]SDL73483.1 hypothetical protein SAMN05216191_105146 [Paenibacillus jilunlii]
MMGADYGCGCGNNVGGVNQGPPMPVCSPFTSTGAILVLFILLVIITKACIF